MPSCASGTLAPWARALEARFLTGNLLPTDSLWLDPGLVMTAAGMTPDPWQRRALHSTARRMMFCCSRQVGKSQIAAAIVLLTAITRAPALILLLSPTLRQSQELFRDKVLPLWTPLQHLAPGTETALTLTLDNGSRIISLPESEKGVRGYSGVALLVIDEASRVSDTLYGGVAPMLAVSGGRMLALTTPFGKRGWFFEEWAKAEKEALAVLRPRWETYRVKASMCPRIPHDFLVEQKESLGDRWYRQEFECSFEDPIDAVFAEEDIQRAVRHDVQPI